MGPITVRSLVVAWAWQAWDSRVFWVLLTLAVAAMGWVMLCPV